MCSPFSCGSFKNQEPDDFDEFLSPCTTPNRSKTIRDHSSKNPYANQGLDKFYALVAELDDKKKKIYTQKGSEDISFIYFTDSNTEEWKPIIVKVKKEEVTNTNNTKDKQMTKDSKAQDKHTIEPSRAVDEVQQPKEELIRSPKTKLKNCSLNFKNWRRVFGYLPVTIVLILLFLAMYGRSFAILCTTVGWYLVPMLKEKSSSSERPKKKNEYVRRLSERNMVTNASPSSPKNVLSGVTE